MLTVSRYFDDMNLGLGDTNCRIGFSENGLRRIRALVKAWPAAEAALRVDDALPGWADSTRLQTVQQVFDESSGDWYQADIWVCSLDTVSVRRIQNNGKRIHIPVTEILTTGAGSESISAISDDREFLFFTPPYVRQAPLIGFADGSTTALVSVSSSATSKVELTPAFGLTAEEIAERVRSTWNYHDPLRDALKALLALHEGVKPSHVDPWEYARMVLDAIENDVEAGGSL